MSASGPSLRLSILDLCDVSAGQPAGEGLQDVLDRASLADALGYERFWIAEHHSDGIATASPELLVPLILSRTSRIRVGPAGILLSYYSPFKVANVFRTIEALFPGRVDLAIGRGRADPDTAAALLDGGPGGPRTYDRKVLDLFGHLRGTLPESHLFSGAQRTPAVVTTTPALWVLGAGRSSVPLAAENGAAFSVGLFLPRAERTEEVIEEYRSTFLPSDASPHPVCNIAVAGCCAPDEAEARAIAATYDNPGIRPSVVGSPEQCRDQLLSLAERHGVDEIVFAAVGGTRQDRTRAFRLLAETARIGARSG